MSEGPNFSKSSSTIVIFQFQKIVAIPVSVKWYLIVVLSFTSLMVNDAEHLFHVFVGHLYILF